MQGSDTSVTEANLYKIARILFLLVILLLALTYYYRRELRGGYEYARARLFPERPVKGSGNAIFVRPWADVELIPFESGLDLPNRKSTRLNSSHIQKSRMPSSA